MIDENWQEKQKYLEKTDPLSTSSTINLTCLDLESIQTGGMGS
jgi:hypothetical protein